MGGSESRAIRERGESGQRDHSFPFLPPRFPLPRPAARVPSQSGLDPHAARSPARAVRPAPASLITTGGTGILRPALTRAAIRENDIPRRLSHTEGTRELNIVGGWKKHQPSHRPPESPPQSLPGPSLPGPSLSVAERILKQCRKCRLVSNQLRSLLPDRDHLRLQFKR